jgi:hypothetical protein
MTNSNRKSVRIGSAAVTLACMLTLTGSVGAFNYHDHENKLTFSSAVALPNGIVLPAGRYAFNIATDTARDVVVVSNLKGNQVFYTGITTSVNRPAGMPWNTAVVMGEAPRNQPRPVITWYEIGNVMGHKFHY